MATEGGPNIVADELVLHLDAANIKSYASQNLEVDVLVVGGGGAGGQPYSGGGGGGFAQTITTSPTPGNYSIVVGSGGNYDSGDRNGAGDSGGNSSAFGTTSEGGGGGNGLNSTTNNGIGGCGGGGSNNNNTSGGTGTQGGNGGDGTNTDGGGGGGGGATQNGTDFTNGGDGGNGLDVSNLFGTAFGDSGTFGGGGGGGVDYRVQPFGSEGEGGIGGGGAGGEENVHKATNGLDGSGGGGGGGSYDGNYIEGGDGGSGIVLIRYKGPQKATGGTITHFNGYTIHAFTSSGIFSVGDFIGDISGNNNSGQLINEPTFVSNNLGSLVFDGVNNAINTELLFDKDDFTYSAWFKWNGSSSQSSQDIIDSIDNNSQEWARIMIWNSTGEFWFVIDNDGFKINGQTGVFIDTNKWYYGVGVWTRSTGLMEAYINGDKVFETTHPNKSTIFAVNSENIGSNSKSNNEFFNGEIPNVQIYNKALTAEEVLQNYNATKSRFGL